MTDISIVIVAWNVAELVNECLAALRNSEDDLDKQVLFVDNGSNDGTRELVTREYPEVEYIRSEMNLGFIRANNLAYGRAKGRYVLMLNSDAFVGPNSLERTVRFMDDNPAYGVLGARLVGRDGERQPSARNFPTPWRVFVARLGLHHRVRILRGVDDLEPETNRLLECDWVPGCFLLARKKALDELEFFLRSDFFMYNDDNDLCLRLRRKGWRTICFPEDVIHVGGANNKKFLDVTKFGSQVEKYSIESNYIYYRKNYGVGSVTLAYFLDCFFHLSQLLKRLLSRDREIYVLKEAESIRLASRILIQTRLGTRAIH